MNNRTESNTFAMFGAITYLFDIKQNTLSWSVGKNKKNDSPEYHLFHSLFGLSENVYAKEKIDSFKSSHTRMDDLIKMIEHFATKSSCSGHVVRNRCSTIGIEVLSFGSTINRQFISNSDVEKFIEYNKFIHSKDDCKLLLPYVLGEKIGIKRHKLKNVFEEYNIEPFVSSARDILYHENDLKLLEEIQWSLLNDIHQNYYTDEQLKNLEGISFYGANKFFIKYKKTIPLICKVKRDNFDYSFVKNIIAKNDVEKAIFEWKNAHNPLPVREKNETRTKENRDKAKTGVYTRAYKEEVNAIFYKYASNPYEAFLKFLEHFRISFHHDINFTKYHWNDFIRKKLNATTQTNDGLKKLIMKFVNTTELLTEIIGNKEIISLPTKQIDSFLFSENIPIAQQQVIYGFLNQLTTMLKNEGVKGISFNVDLIKNPKNKLNKDEKSIYTTDEFLQLIDYSSNVEFHLPFSLNEAMKQLNGDKEFSNYANMWLYVIIHLNNAWRSEDILNFPCLPHHFFEDTDFDWFKTNELSQDDISLIINYYRGRKYIHSKTGQDRYFIVSKELETAFAYSVLISTIVQRKLFPLSKQIMVFPNSSAIYGANHKAFFESFLKNNQNFTFRSMKMNRSLLSFMVSVVGRLTDRNPVELVKFMRNHSDIDITNIYLDIPQDKLDIIATQLFNIGNFGFVYDALSTIVNGTQENDRNKRLENSLVMKGFFQSIEKIEGVSQLINTLIDERNVVIDILNNTPKEELREKYTLLNLGLSPSKNNSFQCLIGEHNCPFSTVDCQKCTLCIPNIYTLSSINERMQSILDEFGKNFNKTNLPSEKTRLANHLYIEKELLAQAIEKFGRDHVEHFIDGGFEGLNSKWSGIPSFKDYISIQERG